MNLNEYKIGDKLDILVPSDVFVVDATEDYIVIESSLSMTEVKENGTISLMNTFKQLKINRGESKNITLARTDYKGTITLMY
jgi:hypothetical protein